MSGQGGGVPGGGRVGEGQGEWERRSEAFVKIKKKKKILGGGWGGSGWGGGHQVGGGGSGWMLTEK